MHGRHCRTIVLLTNPSLRMCSVIFLYKINSNIIILRMRIDVQVTYLGNVKKVIKVAYVPKNDEGI